MDEGIAERFEEYRRGRQAVPDTTQVKVDPEPPVREGILFIHQPLRYLHRGNRLQLKDSYGGRVIAITMAPQRQGNLRRCLALGVDDVILVFRPGLRRNTLATSLVLAETHSQAFPRRSAPWDLVICGKQTIDGDTAQVGPGIAGFEFEPADLVDRSRTVDPEKVTVRWRGKLEGRKEIALPGSRPF